MPKLKNDEKKPVNNLFKYFTSDRSPPPKVDEAQVSPPEPEPEPEPVVVVTAKKRGRPRKIETVTIPDEVDENKKVKKSSSNDGDDDGGKDDQDQDQKDSNMIKRKTRVSLSSIIVLTDSDEEDGEKPNKKRIRKSSRIMKLQNSSKIESYFEPKPKPKSYKNKNDSSSNSDEEYEEEKPKRKKSRKSIKLKSSLKIESYFERPKASKDKRGISKEEMRTKKRERLAFLHSGLPEEVLRAQKLVETRRQESILLEKFHIFPKFTHTIQIQTQSTDEEFDSKTFEELLPSNLKLKTDYSNENITVKYQTFPLKLSEKTDLQDAHLSKIQSELCCGNNLKGDYLEPIISSDEKDPWIDQVQIITKKDLVVDMKAYRQLEEWIKQWKRDIKDDGGLGRKVVEKRRRGDDGFTTSDSEGNDENLLKKSVLLSGVSGSGKIAAIYYLASKYNFQVVEESFSNKRSGKDVLSRVEEATLSNRLNQSSNSLILFKDVDLIFEEEDEGFMGAISQLITASCRPIVMTTNLHQYASLDQKVEKHDPLRIAFELQDPDRIVNRILFSNFQTDDVSEDKIEQMRLCLNSIVRHSENDIRKSINLTQFLFSTKDIKTERFHNNILEPFDLNFVTNFVRVKKSDDNSDNDSVTPKSKIKKLFRISKSLSLLSDVDIYSEKEKKYCDKDDYSKYHLISCKNNFFSSIDYINELNSTSKAAVNDSKINKEVNFIRGVLFENDSDINQLDTAISLRDDLNSYMDSDFCDYDSMSYVRTIVKTSLMNSIGNEGRRNRRMPTYFNRLDTAIIDKISKTFLY